MNKHLSTFAMATFFLAMAPSRDMLHDHSQHPMIIHKGAANVKAASHQGFIASHGLCTSIAVSPPHHSIFVSDALAEG